MITVSELIGKDGCAAELSDLRLWDMDAEEVMPAHLQGFFYRSRLRTDRETARQCANFIAKEITSAFDRKIIRNDRLTHFSISEPPYLSGELRTSLESLSLVSRRCVYFALLMGITIDQASSLTWNEVKQMRESGLMVDQDAALDVLDQLPRHFRSPLVFWEMSSQNQPVSLIGLRAEVETIFCMTYDELMEKFQTMLFVDPSIHADELRQIWRAN